MFPSVCFRVAYIITLLAGPTREWVTAAWEAGASFYVNLSSFTAEMNRVFDHSTHGREAAHKLLQLHQGNRLVSDFAIVFQTLVLSTGWDRQAQFDAFHNGLSKDIKDELSTQKQPSTFEDLVNLTIRVNNCFHQHCRECHRGTEVPGAATSAGINRLMLHAEPTQLDQTCLSVNEWPPMRVCTIGS